MILGDDVDKKGGVMAEKDIGTCPLCGHDNYKSKAEMASAILKKIGYPEKKLIYSDGNFSRYEMLAVYRYVVEGKKIG